jgi:hypothetical protein
LEELVADKGYHGNQTRTGLDVVGIRSGIAQPDRGQRTWTLEAGGRIRRLGPTFRVPSIRKSAG